MQRAIHDLLTLASSQEEHIRRQVVLQLAMLLERSYQPMRTESREVDLAFYASILPAELLTVTLKEEEQRRVIERLAELIASDRRMPDMFWAVGKASPLPAIGPLLRLLRDYAHRFDEDTVYQALIALDNFLFTRDEKLLVAVKREMKANSPVAFLETIAGSKNLDLARISRHLLDELRQDIGIDVE